MGAGTEQVWARSRTPGAWPGGRKSERCLEWGATNSRHPDTWISADGRFPLLTKRVEVHTLVVPHGNAMPGKQGGTTRALGHVRPLGSLTPPSAPPLPLSDTRLQAARLLLHQGHVIEV